MFLPYDASLSSDGLCRKLITPLKVDSRLQFRSADANEDADADADADPEALVPMPPQLTQLFN